MSFQFAMGAGLSRSFSRRAIIACALEASRNLLINVTWPSLKVHLYPNKSILRVFYLVLFTLVFGFAGHGRASKPIHVYDQNLFTKLLL